MSRLHFHIKGASPYGFRLVGGNGQPVVITKLRMKSKAADAGLKEGDIVIAVNGYSCQEVSYERLMSLVEHAGHYLDIDVLRGGSGITNMTVKSPLMESRDRNRPTFDNMQNGSDDFSSIFDEDALLSPSFDLFPATNRSGNNNFAFSPQPEVPRFGGKSPLGVDRKFADQKRASPSVWSPSVRHQPEVTWNPDRSITMSLALPGDEVDARKENEAPWPSKTHRNESFLMINSPPPPPPPSSSSVTKHVWQPPAAAKPHAPTVPFRHQSLEPDDEIDRLWQNEEQLRQLETSRKELRRDLKPIPPHVQKILQPSSDAESVDSLSPTGKKKKVFIDSSFYSDPQHSYPTVEEQIKMARKVAQSLTAPVNESARGHQMFLKRKERSVNWTTDYQGDTGVRETSDSEDPYYNPTPWTATKTWTPSTAPQRKNEPATPAMPMSYMFAAPKLPLGVTEERSKAMSADEFERVRLFDTKTTHDVVAPQVCFSLAEDLRQMKGKGGRMFAKRRAKADQWTHEGTAQPDRRVMDKISGDYAMRSAVSIASGSAVSPTSPAAANDAALLMPTSNRLKEMLELTRAKMTPWDAAVEYGHVDPAFEHLRDFIFVSPTSEQSATSGNERRTDRPVFNPSAVKSTLPSSTTASSKWNGSVNGGTGNNTSPSSARPFTTSQRPAAIPTGDIYRPVHFSTAI